MSKYHRLYPRCLLWAAIFSCSGSCLDDLDLEDLVDPREMAQGLEEVAPQVIMQAPSLPCTDEIDVMQHLFGAKWDQPERHRPSQKLSPFLLAFLQTIQTCTTTSIGKLHKAMPDHQRPADASSITRLVQKYEKLNWISRQAGTIRLQHKGLVAITHLTPFQTEIDRRSKKRERADDEDVEAVLQGLKHPDHYYSLLSACRELSRRDDHDEQYFTTEQIKIATRLKHQNRERYIWDALFATAVRRGWLQEQDGRYALAIDSIDQIIEALKLARRDKPAEEQTAAPQKKVCTHKLKEIDMPALLHKDIYLGLLDQLGTDTPRTNHDCLTELKSSRGDLHLKDHTILNSFFRKLEKAEWVAKRKAGKTSTFVITQKGLAKREELRKLVYR